jgi:hypothetical protein
LTKKVETKQEGKKAAHPLVWFGDIRKKAKINHNAGPQSDLKRKKSRITMSALSLLTEATEAAESRSLKINTDMLLVKVWAQNSLYQFLPFIFTIPHAKSLLPVLGLQE